jgi:nucleotide-binding universal stress UspA family protein
MKRFPIGVGIDGSAASLAAARWAASEAARREVPLKVVHVCEIDPGSQWVMPRLQDRLDEACPVMLDAIQLIHQTRPEVEVTQWRLTGSAASKLLLATQWADLLVLGRPGKAWLAAHLSGSVTHRLTAHAHCPIVTVPPQLAETANSNGPRQIVVGLADQPTEGRAIDFALTEAARHCVDLLAVRVWEGDPSTEPGQLNQEQDELLAANTLLAAHRRAAASTVRTSCLVRAGSPAGVLSSLCGPTDLLILGQHRHGPVMPARVGKVIANCLNQAPCPVAVVPEPVVAAERAGQSRTVQTSGLISY